MAQLTLKKNGLINETNFGDIAQQRIQQYIKEPFLDKKKKINTSKITSTKIRSILQMINRIYNSVVSTAKEELSENQLADLAYTKVKIAYECGREETVDDFVKRTGIMEPIDQIVKSKKKDDFLLYCRYVESLVGYFKYYGGKD